ncbi:MAG: DnaJ domain-containing protein [Proteobacteria bacterium]|jgi:molecular chaperone DnaJ|nr:DnaJ domain-containing protein [Pseudomonadota bacterium]
MDYYDVLGVNKDASEEEINKAFREKAVASHPDINPNKPELVEQFKEVAKAFETLGDPQKRAQYDRQRSGIGTPFGFNFGGDIFGNMFRGPMGRSRQHPIVVEVVLTFQESILGCRKDIPVKVRAKCKECTDGVKEWKTCDVCHGSGGQTSHQGPFVIHTTCTACGGQGKVAQTKCDACSGSGYKGTEENIVSVDIPSGIEDRSVLQVPHAGEVDSNGRKGDLHIKVTVQSHPFYTRHGPHIFCHVPVTYTQLVLGADIVVPTLTGEVKMTIPPRTVANKKLRLRGMGIARQHGDMYAVLEPKFPDQTDKEYDEIVQKLASWEKAHINIAFPSQ